MTERAAATGRTGRTGGTGGDIFTPPVVVRPPTRGAKPYRRVEIYGRTVGKAYGEADVAEFIRRAGVAEPDLDDPVLVGWRGGDRSVWAPDGGPTDDGPADAGPADRPAADDGPADERPADRPAADDGPAGERPGDATSAEQTPADEAPTG